MTVDPKRIREFLVNEYPEMVKTPLGATAEQMELLKQLFPSDIPPAPSIVSLAFVGSLVFGDSERIMRVFNERFGRSGFGLIEHYLGLDTWETGGNRDEAIRRIVKAYAEGSLSLDLSDLKLTSLPKGLIKLTQLSILNADKNALTDLPSEFGNMTTLTMLNLAYNKIEALPASIGKLTRLQFLNVSENQLTEIPDPVWQLPNLNHLIASHNRLNAISEKTKLPKLTNLQLQYNRLDHVPPFLKHSPDLDELNLSFNYLTDLSDDMGTLAKLKTLYLNNNRLSQLPKTLKDLKNLDSLNISRNELTDVSPISTLKELRVLIYSYNQLKEDPRKGFKLALSVHQFDHNPFLEPPVAPPPKDSSKKRKAEDL